MEEGKNVLEGDPTRPLLQRVTDSARVCAREASTLVVLFGAATILQVLSLVPFGRDLFFGFEFWIAGLAYLRHLSLLARGERADVSVLVQDSARRAFSRTGLMLAAGCLLLPAVLFGMLFLFGPILALVGSLFVWILVTPIMLMAGYIQVGMVHAEGESMEPVSTAWRVLTMDPVRAALVPFLLMACLATLWVPMRFVLIPLAMIPAVGKILFTVALSGVQALIVPLLATHGYLVYVDSLAPVPGPQE